MDAPEAAMEQARALDAVMLALVPVVRQHGNAVTLAAVSVALGAMLAMAREARGQTGSLEADLTAATQMLRQGASLQVGRGLGPVAGRA